MNERDRLDGRDRGGSRREMLQTAGFAALAMLVPSRRGTARETDEAGRPKPKVLFHVEFAGMCLAVPDKKEMSAVLLSKPMEHQPWLLIPTEFLSPGQKAELAIAAPDGQVLSGWKLGCTKLTVEFEGAPDELQKLGQPPYGKKAAGGEERHTHWIPSISDIVGKKVEKQLDLKTSGVAAMVAIKTGGVLTSRLPLYRRTWKVGNLHQELADRFAYEVSADRTAVLKGLEKDIRLEITKDVSVAPIYVSNLPPLVQERSGHMSHFSGYYDLLDVAGGPVPEETRSSNCDREAERYSKPNPCAVARI